MFLSEALNHINSCRIFHNIGIKHGFPCINPLFANGPLLGHYMYYVECQRATFGPPVWFQVLSEDYCDVKHIFPKCQEKTFVNKNVLVWVIFMKCTMLQRKKIEKYLHPTTISLDDLILNRRSSYTHERHSFTRHYV